MRKFLTILFFIFIILSVLSEAALPTMASGAFKAWLQTKLATGEVQVDLHSMPSFRLLGGSIDTLNAAAQNAKVGKLHAKELTLTGEDVHFDMPGFAQFDGAKLRSAKRLDLCGIVDEENLREFIVRQAPKLDDVAVSITPEAIKATAGLKVFGRKAEAELEGLVVANDDALYFRLIKLNISNVPLGKAIIGEFFDDIPIARLDSWPPQIKFDNVELRQGEAVVTASWHE